MISYTKGPWILNKYNGHVESEFNHGVSNDGWIICSCEGPDAEGNARLISKAPEMLELLKYCKEFFLESGFSAEIEFGEQIARLITEIEGDE